MPPPPVIALLGLPGVGKTRTALELAALLAGRSVPVLVLHTDLLKVTARQLRPDAPRGPGYAGAIAERCRWIDPLLTAHADKAARDGYHLIIEGTLAAGFRGPGVWRALLEAPEADRRARAARKHPAAARSLAAADLDDYRDFLAGQRREVDQILPCRGSQRQTASAILAAVER